MPCTPLTVLHSSFLRPKAFINHRLPLLISRGIRDVVLLSSREIGHTSQNVASTTQDGTRLIVLSCADDYGVALRRACLRDPVCVIVFAETETFDDCISWCYKTHRVRPMCDIVLVTCACGLGSKHYRMLEYLSYGILKAVVVCQECSGTETLGAVQDSLMGQDGSVSQGTSDTPPSG